MSEEQRQKMNRQLARMRKSKVAGLFDRDLTTLLLLLSPPLQGRRARGKVVGSYPSCSRKCKPFSARAASSELITPSPSRSSLRKTSGGPTNSRGETTPSPLRSIAWNQRGTLSASAVPGRDRLATAGIGTPPQEA